MKGERERGGVGVSRNLEGAAKTRKTRRTMSSVMGFMVWDEKVGLGKLRPGVFRKFAERLEKGEQE